MNENLIKVIGTVAAFLIIGLFILIDVLTGQGNSLANTYLYAAIGGLILGIASPKAAIFPILILSVNVDLLKRLMVVYGYTSEQDLYWIMGLAPLMLAGVVFNLVMSHLTGKRLLAPNYQLLFVIATILCVLMTAGTVLAMGISGRALGNAINGGLYWYLIFVVPVLFGSVEERAKLLRFIVVLFIPVAGYMYYHYYIGLNQFEIDYLESGLSIEVRVLSQNFGDLSGKDGGMRGFSTMSGASVVSTMLSTLILLAMTPLKPGRGHLLRFKTLLPRIGIALLFMTAAYFTMTRKGWFCGVAAVAAYWAFRTQITTLLAYGAAIFTFIGVVLASPAIVEYRLLDDLEGSLRRTFKPDDAAGQKAFILGTMYDRFRGWANLTEPEIWTPFGFKAAGMENELDKETATRMWGHDITVDLLIRLGYVPLFFLGIGGVFATYWFHSNLLSMPRYSLERKVALLCFAMAIGISFGAFANANQLKAFPQNLYAFLFLGITTATILEHRARVRNAVPVLETPRQPEVTRLENPVLT